MTVKKVGDLWLLWALFVCLSACSGGSQKPVIKSPSVVQVQENTSVVYQVEAEGLEPLSYHLVGSEDQNAFLLDSGSGEMVGRALLDYENAADSDADNEYLLNIHVIDANGLTSYLELTVQVLNQQEYSVAVNFPVSGSNIAGGESEFRLRGVVHDDKGKSVAIPEGLIVSVGEIEATVSEQDPLSWVLDMPVIAGRNDLVIQLKGASAVEHALPFVLDNSAVPNFFNVTQYDKTRKLYYNIALDNSGLISITEDDGTVATAVDTPLHVEGNIYCGNIITFEISDSGRFIPFLCGRQAAVSSNDSGESYLMLLDTDNHSIQHLPLPFYADANKAIAISENELVVSNYNSNVFVKYDLTTLQYRVFRLSNGDGSDNFDGRRMNIFDHTLYCMDNNTGLLAYVSLAEIDRSLDIFALPVPFTTDVPLGDGLIIEDQRLYFDEGNLVSQDIKSGETKVVASAVVGQGVSWPDEGDYKFRFTEVVSGSSLVFFDSRENHAVRVDINTGARQLVPGSSNHPLANIGDISFDNQRNELVSFNRILNKISIFDLERDRVLKQYSTRDYDSVLGMQTVVQAKYSWASEKLYIVPTHSWFGSVGEDLVHLFEFDFSSGELSPLITGDDLGREFPGGGPYFRIGDVSFNDNSEHLLFSLFGSTSEGSDKVVFTGEYRLNLQDGAITLLDQRDSFDEGVYVDPGYIGPYSPEREAYLTSSWPQGYLRLMQENGEQQDVIASLAVFETIYSPVWSAGAKEIFAYTYPLKEEGSSIFRYPSLMAINPDDASYRLIVNEDLGRGLNIWTHSTVFNENNATLLLSHGSRLMVLDPESGDRALWPLR